MDRDEEGVAAALAIVPFLYMAWFFTWFGTFAGTCTGSDPKSLVAGMLYSVLFYAVGIFCLHRSDLGTAGVVLALPLLVLLLRQAAWAAELFVVVNIEGRSACSLMMGEEFGEARGGGLEYVSASYYFLVSMGSLGAILLSHWRHRKSQRPKQLGDAID